MRRIITILTVFAISVASFAQSSDKISYQAVVRDAGNALVSSQQIGVQISLIQGSISGTVVYSETHTPTSGTQGLVSLEIGSGVVGSGEFASVHWGNGPFFVKTEIDPAGGTNYSVTGVSQLLSVPYALHAKTAENIVGGITDSTDIANMGFVAGAITEELDGDPENELQVLSINSDTIFISDGNYIILPEDKVDDADADSTNEKISELKLNGEILELTEGGKVYTVDLSSLATQAYQTGYNEGKTKGFDVGYPDGVTDGYNIGYTSGYNDGWGAGYSVAIGAK